MADLPNINTANVGIIAFWNAEDHKIAGVVDPLDCTGVFTSYDVYDNGLNGYKTLGSGRHFNCRVKNDGWCIAWIDRTNTFFYPDKALTDFGESGYKGYYDIMENWVASNNLTGYTMLQSIIASFEAALETSGDFTFSKDDVGHYCYEFPNANVFTITGKKASGAAEETGYVQYTPGTTIYHTNIACRNSPYIIGGGHTRFATNDLVSHQQSATTFYAAADILSEGWMPNSLTDYALDCLHYSAVAGILSLWS